MARKVILAMQDADKTGEELRTKVSGVVGVSNWTESLAKAVLAQLDHALEKGMQMKGPLKKAFDEAVSKATGFARDHPVYTTVIALGILVVLLPWVIEALGFGELGPIEGMWASSIRYDFPPLHDYPLISALYQQGASPRGGSRGMQGMSPRVLSFHSSSDWGWCGSIPEPSNPPW
jgi:hypothetical protein